MRLFLQRARFAVPSSAIEAFALTSWSPVMSST
jgi:hypothetical protein